MIFNNSISFQSSTLQGLFYALVKSKNRVISI
jgi:hypothetical protein